MNGSSVDVKCNGFTYVGQGGCNPAVAGSGPTYGANPSNQITITPSKIFSADSSISISTIGGQSIKISPPIDHGEASLSFYRYNNQRTSVAGDYWTMGHAAYGSGTGGFGLGTYSLGPCLTIGTDGKVRCPNGLYNGSGVRIASVDDVVTINPQLPTNAQVGQSHHYAVDSVGNSCALLSSDTITINQEQFGPDGLPITFSLAKSYVGNISINTRDSHSYIQLALTPDDTGTEQTLNLEYTPLPTKLSTY